MAQAVFELDRARVLRKELKIEWAEMWRSKLDDKMISEAISNKDFKWLFVDQGQILFASRDFKSLSFGEIMEKYMSSDTLGKISPDPSIGGWRRFVNEKIKASKTPQNLKKIAIKADPRQQKKNNGRGWLSRKGISN